MFKPPSIFVQIPAYRDPECAPTIANLFEQAENPARIFVGICWQYQPGEEGDAPEVPEKFKSQVRVSAYPINESKGVSWARHQAQKLYRGETYTLMIDSHSRFAKGWDATLMKQLQQCATKKAVLSCHPAEYVPSMPLQDAPLTVVRAHPPNLQGEIRLRGETLDKKPLQSLRGAFATPAFLFSSGKLINEVPSDPGLYFEQEEICYSARLFTHGWDVYHPTEQVVYHLYDTTPVRFKRYKHWDNNAHWSVLNQSAMERRGHLLGQQIARSEAALKHIEKYSLGKARSLEQYAEFCGIDFASGTVSRRALTCGFIEDLRRYRDLPIEVQTSNAQQQKADIYEIASQAVKPERILSPYLHIPVTAFKPVRTDILDTPIYHPPQLKARSGNAPKLITEGVPPGVLLVENYASPELCRYLMDYSERTLGTKLKVVDAAASAGGEVVAVESANRRTESVPLNEITGEILTLFIEIYTQRLSPFYGVQFEWFERPQILRYRAGGRYDPHADADDIDQQTGQWVRVHDRDISVLLYLNDDYEGGKISFESIGFSIQPKAGMLLAFPSDYRYLHAAQPTTSGIRYVIVSWSAYLKSLRVKQLPPYASVMLHLSNG